MKNMAAPYAAAAPTHPTAIPAVVDLTVGLVFWAFVSKTPLFPEFPVALLLAPLPVELPRGTLLPGCRGIAGLM